MRKDMKKVIVTPARTGGGYNGDRREANRDLEDLPTKESMRKKHIMNWDGKELSDFLNPLRRFLYKQTGRPWNKVYSEICKYADSRSTMGNHLRDHVFMEIEFEVTHYDGRVYMNPKYYSGFIELWKDALYVDTKDGLLKQYKRGVARWNNKLWNNYSIEKKIASSFKPYKVQHGSIIKEYDLELIDEKLYKTCITNNNAEFRTYSLANVSNANQDFTTKVWDSNKNRGLYRIILSNLKEAHDSNSDYIKAWAKLVTEHEKEELLKKANKNKSFDQTLTEDKKARKSIKRAAGQI